MKKSPILTLAAALFLTVMNGAYAQNLMYGDKVRIQNGYGSPTFLDTRSSGCQGNVYCVSTASSFDRDGGSGSWVIKSATGKADGTAVNSFDQIHLVNQYGNPTYLDTRGSGCQDDYLCVSTATSANRDSGSGTWLIIKDQWATGPIAEGNTLRFMNGYAGWNGGYLDTRSSGCQDNVYCVSTSSSYNRDAGSTTWRMHKQ